MASHETARYSFRSDPNYSAQNQPTESQETHPLLPSSVTLNYPMPLPPNANATTYAFQSFPQPQPQPQVQPQLASHVPRGEGGRGPGHYMLPRESFELSPVRPSIGSPTRSQHAYHVHPAAQMAASQYGLSMPIALPQVPPIPQIPQTPDRPVEYRRALSPSKVVPTHPYAYATQPSAPIKPVYTGLPQSQFGDWSTSPTKQIRLSPGPLSPSEPAPTDFSHGNVPVWSIRAEDEHAPTPTPVPKIFRSNNVPSMPDSKPSMNSSRLDNLTPSNYSSASTLHSAFNPNSQGAHAPSTGAIHDVQSRPQTGPSDFAVRQAIQALPSARPRREFEFDPNICYTPNPCLVTGGATEVNGWKPNEYAAPKGSLAYLMMIYLHANKSPVAFYIMPEDHRYICGGNGCRMSVTKAELRRHLHHDHLLPQFGGGYKRPKVDGDQPTYSSGYMTSVMLRCTYNHRAEGICVGYDCACPSGCRQDFSAAKMADHFIRDHWRAYELECKGCHMFLDSADNIPNHLVTCKKVTRGRRDALIATVPQLLDMVGENRKRKEEEVMG